MRASLGILIAVFRQAGDDRAVAVHPLLLDTTVFQSLEQRATGLAIMLAVTEAAGANQVVELDETGFDICTADVTQAKFANTRGVDQFTAAWEVVQARGRGGVRTLARPLRQIADSGLHFG